MGTKKSRTEKQQTLAKPVRYSGIALHTGVRARLHLKPAPPNAGIGLVRLDLDGQPLGNALANNVIDVQRATTIACGAGAVHTVEHLLAALYACEVDNAIIEMDGPEPPVADGSSRPYVDLIEAAGVVTQNASRRIWQITEPVWVERNDSKLIVLPSDEFRIACTVKFGASVLDTQYMSLAITRESFAAELSLARTFCLYEEIETLMKAGLIRGGSLDNAVVIKDGVIVSKDGLRYSDEFVRHKMLDIIGDLSLVGRRFRGQVIAVKPGHALNVALAQKLVSVMESNQEG